MEEDDRDSIASRLGDVSDYGGQGLREGTMKHELKIWPEFFLEVVAQKKTFEIRNEYDRHFEAGDQLVLKEFDPKGGRMTGRRCEADVKYVHRGLGLEKDFCAMSIEVRRVYAE